MKYGNDIIWEGKITPVVWSMMPTQKTSRSTCFLCLPQSIPAKFSQEA
jgi:hypothetical protein